MDIKCPFCQKLQSAESICVNRGFRNPDNEWIKKPIFKCTCCHHLFNVEVDVRTEEVQKVAEDFVKNMAWRKW